MSKRFTETMKWEDPWFRKLSPEKKLLWQFICDKCDNAGIWKVDYELASFCIGTPVTESTVLAMNDDEKMRAKILNDGQLVFLSDYVSFQIGDISTFSSSNNATNLQKNCISSIRKYIDKGILQESDYGIEDGCLRVAYPYRTGIGIGKGKGKGKDIGKGKGDSKGGETKPYGEFQNVLLTDKEYAKLLAEQGQDRLNEGIEILGDYMKSKGKRYKCHYAVLKKTGWVWSKIGSNDRRDNVIPPPDYEHPLEL